MVIMRSHLTYIIGINHVVMFLSPYMYTCRRLFDLIPFYRIIFMTLNTSCQSFLTTIRYAYMTKTMTLQIIDCPGTKISKLKFCCITRERNCLYCMIKKNKMVLKVTLSRHSENCNELLGLRHKPT